MLSPYANNHSGYSEKKKTVQVACGARCIIGIYNLLEVPERLQLAMLFKGLPYFTHDHLAYIVFT